MVDLNKRKRGETMKISCKHPLVWVIVSWMFIVFVSGCAYKKAYKKAVEYEKSGRYVEAAEKDLEALDKKPDYKDALQHLQTIAPRAYEELLNRAETYETNLQWVEAVKVWEHLDGLLRRFRHYNVSLQTIDVLSRLSEARLKGRDYFYSNAQRNFEQGEYSLAIENFKKVEAIAGAYRDTRVRIWESYIRLGDQKLQQNLFENAIENYRAGLAYASDPAETIRHIAEAYYQWAENMAGQGKYRDATELYEKVMEIVPGYKDTESRHNEVLQKAIRRVAILPFRNSTSYSPQYSNLLTEELINRCIQENLKYAVFITRSNLDQILEEYKLAMAGVVDPSRAAEIGKLEGIHYFVNGTVTQISVQTTRPSFVEKSHQLTYAVKDTAGNEVKQTRTIYYREYTTTRTVQISAGYQIIDVATGRYVTGKNFTEKVIDEARYVRYQGSIYDLPKDKQSLVDAPTEPRSADMLINEGMRRIAAKMGAEILSFLR